MNTAIAQAVEEGNLYEIEDMVNAALAAGESPKELLEALMAGLKDCGDRFETGEYFLPELLGAGDAFKAGMAILAPKLAVGDRVSQGTVVLGTVQGDVHDIGKNLVGFMLSSAGFTVVDIGVDVSTGEICAGRPRAPAAGAGHVGAAHDHHAGHGGRDQGAEEAGLEGQGEGDHRRRTCVQEVC